MSAMLRRLVFVLACACLALAAAPRAFAASARAEVSSQPATVDRVAELHRRGLESYRATTPDLAGARASWSAALALAREEGRSAALRAELLKALGNVAFRQERPLEAAAWFTAAIRLAPRDRDAWANLELARAKAGLPPEDRGDLGSAARRLLWTCTLAESEWLVALAGLVLLALLCLRAWVVGSAVDRPLVALCLILLVLLVPWVARLRDAGSDPLFVVSTAGVDVLSEPRAGSARVAVLSAGARAERVEELAGWTRVVTADGVRGWASAESLFALAR